MTEKNRICTDTWALRIWMVFLVDWGTPETRHLRETDRKGLEGQPVWTF